MPATIYKKTLANVLSHVIDSKRTEIKVAAKTLNITKDSARIALNTLTRYGFIKERKYKDIGVSYYYPSDNRVMTIFVLDPAESFVFVCDTSMNIKYNMAYGMVPYMDTKMNMHHFIKRMGIYLRSDSGEIPGAIPFLAVPGKVNEINGKIISEQFPDLIAKDIEKYLRELMGVKRIGIFGYDYLPSNTRHNVEFLRELMLGATMRFFKKKKKSTNKTLPNKK